jgi:tRNA threonylcarbamoyladenosine biosynthesis protein TsaB
MSFFIGIETGTDNCSVAIFEDAQLLAIEEERGRVHSEKTALFLTRVLQAAGVPPDKIAAVGVSIGPGSYTGLRVGLSIAKGFCYGLDIPLIAIDSLAILAAGSIAKVGKKGSALHCPMIDARRMEAYCGLYKKTGEEIKAAAPVLLETEFTSEFAVGSDIIYLSGDGVEKAMTVPEIADRSIDSGVRPSAEHMGSLIYSYWRAEKRSSTAYSTPKYLKKPNITRSKKTLI